MTLKENQEKVDTMIESEKDLLAKIAILESDVGKESSNKDNLCKQLNELENELSLRTDELL